MVIYVHSYGNLSYISMLISRRERYEGMCAFTTPSKSVGNAIGAPPPPRSSHSSREHPVCVQAAVPERRQPRRLARRATPLLAWGNFALFWELPSGQLSPAAHVIHIRWLGHALRVRVSRR